MIEQTLNGKWQLRSEALSVIGPDGLAVVGRMEQEWIEATVPGEVHLDLVAAGLMEEPLYSTNAPACRWPEDRSWWHRIRFDARADLLAEEQQELIFEGLDYFAQVFLNGRLLGEARNAFIPAVFDVTHILCAGPNELVVRLTAGNECAAKQRMGDAVEANNYRRNFEGVSELRKPQFCYGWDWVDSLPNIGIWRGVTLQGRSEARLHDLWPRVVLSDDHRHCSLHVDVDIANLHPWAETDYALTLTLLSPDGSRALSTATALLPVGISRVRRTFEIDNPQLWWPNGYGAQPLYTIEAELSSVGAVRDHQRRSIGLRTITIDRSPLPEGHRFAVQVNGRDIFCKGGNWIPADAIIARVTQERYDALIDAARDAHMTMLRIWGGGIYESEHFYNACDRNGILVWQDFMFACSLYPDQDEAFRDKVRKEAECVIRSLRHHPSIALWSANNENTWGLRSWWNGGRGYPSADLALGGRHLYSRVLPEACRSLDPDRPYWPGSPAGGEDPNSETEGDCHWWHLATMHADIARRYRHEVYDECRSRFVSEYGVIGPCHIESIAQFLKPEEMDVSTKAWRIHTNTFEKETTPAAIRYHYADPEGLSTPAYIRYGQMFQALMYGRTIESMRFRKGDAEDDCNGALIWMYNDCWGETGWTPIDYYMRRKASYYWIKNACYPVRAIVRRRGDTLVVRAVNDSLAERKVRIRFGWLRVDGAESLLETVETAIPANGMCEVASAPIPAESDMAWDEWVYAAYCDGDDIDAIPGVWPLKPHRALKIPPDTIAVSVSGRQITLRSRVYSHGVCHHDAGARLFSDNYLDLLPNTPRTIEWLADGPVPAGLTFESVNA